MKKIKEIIKKYSKEIVLSTIVSLLTASVIKGIDWIKEITPTAGNSILRFISNSFYTSASEITETTLISFLVTVLLGFAIVCVINLVRIGFSVAKKTSTLSQKIMNNTSDKTSDTNEEHPKITDEEIKVNTETIVKKSKNIKTMTIILIVVYSFYFSLIIGFDIIPHRVWTEYQKDLIIIAPYIEQQELDVIKSDWVCMRTKEDYEAIYERINQVKEEHNLP